MIIRHTPVFAETIEKAVLTGREETAVDATLGEGGHSLRFLEKGLRVIAFERDSRLIQKAVKRLAPYKEKLTIHNINFGAGEKIFASYAESFQFALFDLGISMYHYMESGLGFSFRADEPLDMRLSPDTSVLRAADVVNTFGEQELADLIYKFGEERLSRRIARAVCKKRDTAPFQTSRQLAETIAKVYPHRGAIHPATRTFQALRIYINGELEAIENGIDFSVKNLAPGGRTAVISYHSLEDRIVKTAFAKYIKKKQKISKYKKTAEEEPKEEFRLMTKKPMVPGRAEIRENPAARSAKMRVLLKAPFD